MRPNSLHTASVTHRRQRRQVRLLSRTPQDGQRRGFGARAAAGPVPSPRKVMMRPIPIDSVRTTVRNRDDGHSQPPAPTSHRVHRLRRCRLPCSNRLRYGADDQLRPMRGTPRRFPCRVTESVAPAALPAHHPDGMSSDQLCRPASARVATPVGIDQALREPPRAPPECASGDRACSGCSRRASSPFAR